MADDLAQQPDVAFLDVPAIFARWMVMPSAPPRMAEQSRRHGIGMAGARRLTHRGHVIDVDAESNHAGNLGVAGERATCLLVFTEDWMSEQKRS